MTPTSAPSKEAEQKRATVRASLWRNRDYMILWAGQSVSSLGSGMSLLAFPFLVLLVTHSLAQAGFIGAVRSLTMLVVTLPAGALIDRWNRKHVMIVCDTGRALVLASIPVAAAIGHLGVALLYSAAFSESLFAIFFDLAQRVSLPVVVTQEQLPLALGQNQATDNVTNFVSLPLGGLLYGLRAVLPFAIDAISYGASVLSLCFIRAPFQQERSAGARNLATEIRDGLTWLWRQRTIRVVALLASVNNFVSAGFALIALAITQQQHLPAAVLGLVLSVGGMGGILGSIVGPRIQKRLSFGQGYAGTILVAAVVWILLIVSQSPAVMRSHGAVPIVLGMVSIGLSVAGAVHNIVLVSYVLVAIPDSFRGRVTSVFRLIGGGLAPAGLALTGLCLQQIGVMPTVLAIAVCKLLVSLGAFLLPAVRNAPAAAETTMA